MIEADIDPTTIKLPRNDIQFGKVVTLTAIADLKSSDSDKFKTILSNVFIKPLFQFPAAYDNFIKAIGNNTELYEEWLNFQIQLYTDFGPYRETVVDGIKQAFRKIIANTPGGDGYVEHPVEEDKLSFKLLLAVRMFGKDLNFNQAVNDE